MDNNMMPVMMLAVNAIMYSLYYFYIFKQNRNRYLALWGFGWIIYSLGYLFVLTNAEQSFSDLIRHSFSLFSGILLFIGTYYFVDKKIPTYLLNSVLCIIITVLILRIVTPYNSVYLDLFSSLILMIISVASGLAFLITDVEAKNPIRELTGWIFIFWGIHKGFYPFVSPDFYFSETNYMTSIVLINAVNMSIILSFLSQDNQLILDQEVSLRKVAEASEKHHADMEFSRQKLLANISHELRTPITSIIGNLSIITDGLVEDQNKIREYANISLQKSIKLNMLIQDLFDLSTQEAMQIHFRRELISIEKIMDQIEKSVDSDISGTKIRLIVSKSCNKRSRSCPYIFVDTLRLDQVVQNLISNSIKSIKDTGNIKVFCNCSNNDSGVDDQTVEIHVSDTGSGISKEDLPYIFDMFYKTPNVNSIPGTGLGLSLSKDIIHYHGGHIEAKSELGVGTELIINLPIETKGVQCEE